MQLAAPFPTHRSWSWRGSRASSGGGDSTRGAMSGKASDACRGLAVARRDAHKSPVPSDALGIAGRFSDGGEPPDPAGGARGPTRGGHGAPGPVGPPAARSSARAFPTPAPRRRPRPGLPRSSRPGGPASVGRVAPSAAWISVVTVPEATHAETAVIAVVRGRTGRSKRHPERMRFQRWSTHEGADVARAILEKVLLREADPSERSPTPQIASQTVKCSHRVGGRTHVRGTSLSALRLRCCMHRSASRMRPRIERHAITPLWLSLPSSSCCQRSTVEGVISVVFGVRREDTTWCLWWIGPD
jgi:hypothetical protein